MIREAVCHRLEVAIDAVGRVGEELVGSEFAGDWPRIVAMRNMLAHRYAELDQEILQNTVDNRLGWFVASVRRLQDVAVQRDAAR
ncbi:MAG: HepT-like ribonuclease domain-containing protein [Thermocrispum sp.]